MKVIMVFWVATPCNLLVVATFSKKYVSALFNGIKTKVDKSQVSLLHQFKLLSLFNSVSKLLKMASNSNGSEL
jgi:hypothetical protein